MKKKEREGLIVKSLDGHFRSWESTAFGFGYGTGEKHLLSALKTFLATCHSDDTYDYRELEEALTPTVAWLLICILCREDIINYGVSPRYAWLDQSGKALKQYVCNRTVEELDEILHDGNPNDICMRDACNCGPTGYEKGRVCPNPFWGR